MRFSEERGVDGGERFYAHYQDHDLTYRSIAQFSKKDAEAYDRFGKDVMRQCKIIKRLLKNKSAFGAEKS